MTKAEAKQAAAREALAHVNTDSFMSRVWSRTNASGADVQRVRTAVEELRESLARMAGERRSA